MVKQKKNEPHWWPVNCFFDSRILCIVHTVMECWTIEMVRGHKMKWKIGNRLWMRHCVYVCGAMMTRNFFLFHFEVWILTNINVSFHSFHVIHTVCGLWKHLIYNGFCLASWSEIESEIQNSSSISFSTISTLSVNCSCTWFVKIVRCVKCRKFKIFYVVFYSCIGPK